MALSVPIDAGVLAVDTSTSKTITIPLANERIGRILVIKDRTGQAATNPITLQLQGSDTFENGTTNYTLAENFGVVTILSRTDQWLFQQNAEELRTSSITFVNSTGFRINASQISTGFVEVSTVNLLDPFTNVLNYLTVSSATLLLNGSFITGEGGGAVTQIIAGSNISVSPPGGTGVVTISGTGPSVSDLVSTVEGLGSVGYISSITDIVSTPNLLDLVSTPNLLDLVSTPNLLDLISTPNLLDLVSTQNLLDLISTPNLLDLVSTPNLLNLVSTGFLDTTLISTVDGLGEIYLSTAAAAITEANLISTVEGLGTLGYVSSLTDLVSTANLLDLVSTPNLLDLVSTPNLLDLVSTPNLLDLVSTPNLLDLVSTANLLELVSTANLLDLVSTPNLLDLVSTPNLLDLVSTPNLLDLVSTPNLLDLVSTPNLLDLVSTANLLELVSTANLLGLVSTPNLLDLVSTPNLLDLVSTPNLLDFVSTSYLDETLISTVVGLGTLGYISTQSGGIASIPDYISTLWISAGSVELSSLVVKDPTGPGFADGFIRNENGLLVYEANTQHLFLTTGFSNTGTLFAKSYGIAGLADGNLNYFYSLGADSSYTGTYSTPVFVDTVTDEIAALYLSSIFIGDKGGTFTGEITTDTTATNLFWNGSQLNNQSGGGGDVPFLSSFTLSTTEIFTSSIGGNEGTLFLNGSVLDLRGVSITDSLTNTVAFSALSNRIDFANNLLSSSAGFIETRNALLLGSTTQINIYVGNGNPDTIVVQDFDQSSYTGVNSNILDNNALCVGDRGDIYVAGGNLDSLNNTFAYSYDGYRWEPAGSNFLDVRVNAFSYNIFSGQLVAVGKNSTDSYTLVESFDGINWQDVPIQPPFTEGRCIANNGTWWVMGGTGPNDTLAYGISPDALAGAGCNVFDDFVAGVAFGLDKWVAVGSVGTTGNTIAYSYDGATWIGLGNSIFDVAGLCVAFNGQYWTAGGVGTTNTIAYSDDGIDWTGDGILFTDSTISLAWRADQGLWYAGGSGGATLFFGDSNGWNDATGNLPTISQINGIVARQQINTSFQLFANGAIGTRTLGVNGLSFLNGITSMNYDSKNGVSQFYVDPNVRKIGIECNTPVRTLDVNGDGYFTTVSTLMVDSTDGYFRSTISTHSLVVYGPSTFLVQGVSFFENFVSAPYVVVDTLRLYDEVVQDFGVIRLENGLLVTPDGATLNQATLNSTIEGLGSLGFVSSASLLDLVSTPNLLNLVSTANLLDLVSTPNLVDLISTPNLLGLLSTANLLDLVSTPNLLNLVSTPNLLNLVSTAFLTTSLTSTTSGLQQSGFISTANLLNLVSTPNLLNLVSTPNLINLVSTAFLTTSLTSTTSGLQRSGFISTPNLLNLVSTPNLLNLVSTPNLLNLISTPNLLNLVSTPNLLNLVSTAFLTTSLTSTTSGLQRSGFISTPNLLNLVSTANLLNLVSTTFLNTTLASTAISYQTSFSTLRTIASSIGIAINNPATQLDVNGTARATTLSSLVTQASTIQLGIISFQDVTTVGATSNVFMSTNYLLYGNNVIGGARQAQAQTITF